MESINLQTMLTPDVLQVILANQAANLNFWQPPTSIYGQLYPPNPLIPQFVPPLPPQIPFFPPPAPPILAPLPENVQPMLTEVPETPNTRKTPEKSEKSVKNEPVEPEPSEQAEESIKFEMGCLPTETYYPTHFMRGTQLHVAGGNVKKVEDLSSDDFLRCAAESTDVTVNASIIKSIKSTSPGSVTIVFETGIEKARIPLKCQIEHPFFVLGKGWSSCNPRKSGENYGLECAVLEINDVCVVLTRNEEPDDVAVDIVTAERDLDTFAQLARWREQIADVFYEHVSGRISAPPERIRTHPPTIHRQRRFSE